MHARFDNKIRQSRKVLQNPYAHLDGEGGYSASRIEAETNVHQARRVLANQYAYLDENGDYAEWRGSRNGSLSSTPPIDRRALLSDRARGQNFSRREIEGIARRLHIELWRNRAAIWPAKEEAGPMDVLDPSAALESVGYSVRIDESLGQYSDGREPFEVAGIFDEANCDVQISRRFAPHIRNFTIAHELGHALLHGGPGLHRDRPLDGSGSGSPREPREVEADLFASYFLMPEKIVRKAFEQRFLTRCFVLNDESAFALTSKNLDFLQSRCRTIRDIARALANAEYYNGAHFHSLAAEFHVSSEAMCIRLEELDLIDKGDGGN
jgi:Zn-dependent peptidase ImmA (M78 family)